VNSVETKQAAKKAEARAEYSKEKEGKARAAWIYAAGLSAKAHQKMLTSKQEGIALGSKLVSMQRVAGAAMAAKGARKVEHEAKQKYELAKRSYARRAAVAVAAVAVHKSDKNTLLPSSQNTTAAVKKVTGDEIKSLKSLLARTVNMAGKDKAKLKAYGSSATNLRESLGAAHRAEKHASYENKYAAHLHEVLVSTKLTRVLARQRAMEVKTKQTMRLAKTYELDEHALEAGAEGSQNTLYSGAARQVVNEESNLAYLQREMAAKHGAPMLGEADNHKHMTLPEVRTDPLLKEKKQVKPGWVLGTLVGKLSPP